MKAQIVDEKLALEISDKLDLLEYKRLRSVKSCWLCKSFSEPLYVENENIALAFELSGKFLAHLQMTHGLNAAAFVDYLSKKLYKNKEDQDKMKELYNYLNQ